MNVICSNMFMAFNAILNHYQVVAKIGEKVEFQDMSRQVAVNLAGHRTAIV